MLSMHKNVSILAGLAGILFLSDSLAQGFEDIVVTAERREADIQEVPLAVTALSLEQIGQLQITQAQDLQRYAPSLNMFNNIVSPTNLSLSMRGGLQQDASIVAAESPIGIYVDDVFIGRLNGNNVTLNDIERVEVLRGPQGTLYGRNTAYGAIKFVTRTPGEDVWFDATAGAGNDSQGLLKASLGGPLGDSGIGGSVSAQYNTKKDQFFNVAENVKTGEEENYAVRGKLNYFGGEKLSAQLMVSYAKSENDSIQLVKGITPGVPSNMQFTTKDLEFPNGEYATNTNWGKIFPEPLRDRPQAETEQTIAALTLAYDFTDRFTFKSITGYVKTEDYFHTDVSGNTAFPGELFGGIGGTEVDSDQITQEFQLLGSIGENLNYIFGFFYLNEDADQFFGWNFPNFFVPGPTSNSRFNVETDSIAVYGEGSYNFTEALKLTLGVRWTEDDKDFDYVFIACGGDPNCAGTPEPIPLSGKFDEVTPRIALDYTINGSGNTMESMLLYAQAARGFKGGGFSAISIFSTDAVGIYGPETSWTYSFGLKADWWGSRFRTNLEYFFSDIEDIQQNATDTSSGGFEFPVENSGDAEIQGLEFELSAVPVDGLNLFLSGTFMDGKFTRLNANSSAGTAFERLGVQPQTPQTPDFVFNVGFDYTIDVDGGLVDNVAFGMDYYKIDDYVTAATNDFFNSGWDQLNGFISVGFGENWELTLTGKNITDETNITSGSRGLGGFIFMKPVEYLFSISYRR